MSDPARECRDAIMIERVRQRDEQIARLKSQLAAALARAEKAEIVARRHVEESFELNEQLAEAERVLREIADAQGKVARTWASNRARAYFAAKEQK